MGERRGGGVSTCQYGKMVWEDGWKDGMEGRMDGWVC